jgi:hypothetical protein
MRRRAVFFFISALVLILAIMTLELRQPARAHTLIVSASYVKAVPTGLDDPIWKTAQAVQLLVEGREPVFGANGTVTTRALYTDDRLFFLFKWKDPTHSITKQSWKFDGQKWYHLEGNEDRIALLFEITRIDKFATRGCAITCHSPADAPRKDWKLHTATRTMPG